MNVWRLCQGHKTGGFRFLDQEFSVFCKEPRQSFGFYFRFCIISYFFKSIILGGTYLIEKLIFKIRPIGESVFLGLC